MLGSPVQDEKMAVTGGLEPPTSGFVDRRSIQLSYVTIAPCWQGRQDLNLQPSELEAAALPVELLP